MFVIIKKGENVNVCIHDFDDAKEESNKVASKDKLASRLIQDCFKKQSLASRLTQDQALP